MKSLKIYCLMLAGLLMAACSGDDAADAGGNGGGAAVTHEPVTVSLNISSQGRTAGRATTTGWAAAANDREKMSNWFVVIANGNNIVKIIESGTLTNPVEQDKYSSTIDNLQTNTAYDFYSFANMSLSDAGLNSNSTTLPTDFATQTFKANGNGFDISADGNYIPMSNKQRFTFTSATTQEVNLWVVRMFAKVELQITNETGSAVSLESITLSDLTKNASATNAANLKLMPNLVDKADEQACTPNLVSDAATADCTFGYGTGELPCFLGSGTSYSKMSSAVSIADKATQNIFFYVNESTTPLNNHGLFILSLKTNTSNNENMRYALITNDDATSTTWSNIARNDWRILPIKLQDYKLELDVFKDTPIGVYPAVEVENNLFTVNFYDAGHFHLLPKVVRLSDNTTLAYTDAVPTGDNVTATTWTYARDTNNNNVSWTAYPSSWITSAMQAASGYSWNSTNNLWTIYEEDATATADGSDNGGQPVWISNLKCGTSGTQGGLMGKLRAATSSTDTSQQYDGRAFHQLDVQVYEGTTAYPRLLTYRLCVNYKELFKANK